MTQEHVCFLLSHLISLISMFDNIHHYTFDLLTYIINMLMKLQRTQLRTNLEYMCARMPSVVPRGRPPPSCWHRVSLLFRSFTDRLAGPWASWPASQVPKGSPDYRHTTARHCYGFWASEFLAGHTAMDWVISSVSYFVFFPNCLYICYFPW